MWYQQYIIRDHTAEAEVGNGKERRKENIEF